ncbi:MAG: hypothetical protein NVS3B20_27590 [Polyangiales bacterium]
MALLTEKITDASLDQATLALQTLAQVVSRRSPVEEIAPGDWRTCAEGLLRGLDTVKGSVRRELMIRVLLSLEERGVVRADQVPAR